MKKMSLQEQMLAESRAAASLEKEENAGKKEENAGKKEVGGGSTSTSLLDTGVCSKGVGVDLNIVKKKNKDKDKEEKDVDSIFEFGSNGDSRVVELD